MKVRALLLLANSYLPEDARDYNMEFSDKGLNRVLYNIAQSHSPEEFVRVNKALSDLGLTTSFMNGETMTLADLAPVIDRLSLYDEMDKELDQLNKKDPDFKKKRDAIHQKYNVMIEKMTSEAALKNRNNIAMAVLSGARGKSSQLKAMISTPGTYTDYKGDPVPVFSRESFAEGVRPVTFLAGSYGTRASVSSIKRGTAKGGDLAKQFALACADLVIRKHDCGTHNGIKLDITDKSCKGRTLANDVGGYHEGDTITRLMLHDFEKKGIKHIVARSPLTCSVENGLCAKCMGKFIDGGKMPKIGDHIGAVSSSTAAEPITQMALCLAVDTEVLMADGSTKKIQNINIGDTVMGADKNANIFPVKVLNTFDLGVKTVRDYRFSKDGKSLVNITATADHKILVNKMSSCLYFTEKYGNSYGPDAYTCKVLPLGKLIKRSYAIYPQTSDSFGDKHITPIFAFLAGLFLGDGCKTHEGGMLRISCADEILADAINTELKPLDMRFKKLARSYDWAVVKNTTHGKNPVKLLIKELEMSNKYCYEKTIADSVFSWDRESLSNFIAGYFDSDGSIYRTKAGQYLVSFSSTSLNLLRKLKLILEVRYAIYSSNIYSSTTGRKRTLHKLAICRLDMVLKFKLAFLPYSKGERLIKLCSVSFIGENRNPSGLMRGKFRSASAPYEKHCYDIEVDHPDHLFVLANGIITSNSSKHTAGMTESKKTYSGLGTIIQFAQSPEKFKDHSAVATLDGKVESIEEAPQGGKYITVSGKQHYVPSGHEAEVVVGLQVEAGDFLSEGLGDPEDVIKYKGLGAGRLYYANRLNQMLADSGAGSDKRLTEVLARGAIRHIRITSNNQVGEYLPDDVVDYNVLQNNYKMPESAKPMKAKEAEGKYLQLPILHYSIGTRITPSVIKDLHEVGYDNVYAADEKPDFEPEMIRLRGASHTNPDWLASQGTSYLTKQLQEGVTRGDDTNVLTNPDWRPRLAFGKDFGKNVTTTGQF